MSGTAEDDMSRPRDGRKGVVDARQQTDGNIVKLHVGRLQNRTLAREVIASAFNLLKLR